MIKEDLLLKYSNYDELVKTGMIVYLGQEMKEKYIEDLAKVSLLFDFYGKLLTDRQREVMELYHEDNLSLQEIAEEFGISKQGVHDTLKKAEKLLTEYEEKLGLVDQLIRQRQVIAEIKEAETLEEVKKIIDKLED